MQTAELDFYTPGVDHKKVRRDRLNQQREAMFSWRDGTTRADADGVHTASATRRNRGSYTNPSASAANAGYQMEPKQIILGDSERARAAQKEAKEKRERGGAVWDSAIGQQHDRRREWRLTGFEFSKEHFRTSADPTSEYHPRNKAQRRLLTLSEARREIEANPYVPYVHDQILLSEPTVGRHVTAIAVTTNAEEARQAEADAAAYQGQRASRSTRGVNGSRSDGAPAERTQTFGSEDGADRVENWHSALGGSVASRQRGAQTAEAMYSELMAQQASLTGTAYGSPESRNVHVPTGELAYTVRPAFLESHAGRTYRGGRRWTLSHNSTTGDCQESGATTADGAQAGGPSAPDMCASTSTRGPDGRDVHGDDGLPHDDTLNSDFHTDGKGRYGSTSQNTRRHDSGTQQEVPLVHTAAEAKSMRVYAVDLHRQVSNKDTSMVTRNEPVRRGVPVLLPDAWVSPGAAPGQ